MQKNLSPIPSLWLAKERSSGASWGARLSVCLCGGRSESGGGLLTNRFRS